MCDKAIEVHNLSKVYKLYNKPVDRLKESINLFKKKYHRDFYALRDVSFAVNKGETLGIIGKNGSGKSTLLKIITGILAPSSGSVQVNGKVSALLELGAGFNPEFTGIENVYLNGTIMGYSKDEIDNKINDIIRFADIGDFIYQPVKTYSSGMFVRLAFAVAISVEPEILIVDEALSVGDIYFQNKCYKRFIDFKKANKTIIVVTHDMGSVLKYSNRVIVLDKGEVVDFGHPKEMVDLYKKIISNSYSKIPEDSDVILNKDFNNWKNNIITNKNYISYGSKNLEIIDYGLFNENGEQTQVLFLNELCSIKMRVKCGDEDILEPILALTIKDIKGTEICGTNTQQEMVPIGLIKSGQIIEVSFSFKARFVMGTYFVSLGCTKYKENGELEVYHRLYDLFAFEVIATKTTAGFFDMNAQIDVIK